MLDPQGLLSLLPCIPQDHLSTRGDTAHKEMGPPTIIINQGNVQQTNLLWALSQLSFALPK